VCSNSAVVADCHATNRINDGVLADPRIVADSARFVTVNRGVLMNAAVVTYREVRASNLHSLPDVSLISDPDAARPAAIRPAYSSGWVDNDALTKLQMVAIDL
jgi:hypothetical protein